MPLEITRERVNRHRSRARDRRTREPSMPRQRASVL